MSFLSALKSGNGLNLRRVRAYPRLFLVLFVVLGAAWVSGLHEIFLPNEGVFVTDFLNVYAAGQQVREGNPAQAYDWDSHQIREDGIRISLNKGNTLGLGKGYLPWVYPPTFFVVAWLAAFLPYWASLITYSIIGLAVFFAAMRKIIPKHTEALWALTAFPGVFANLFSGQNGFITASLFAAGLYLLEASPIAAGMAFGALSYKPHLFVLVPLVLVVGRYWKALIATLASAGVYALLSLIAFGAESWVAFFQSFGRTASLLHENTDRWLGILHSVFSAVRMFGGSFQMASAIHEIVAVVAIMALMVIWKNKSASLAVRGASLAAATLLISPYSFVYDQVLLAIPIALLAGQGLKSGFLSYEKTLLFALWLLPLLVQDSFPHFAIPLTPPLLIGLMVMCWRRGKGEELPLRSNKANL
ncbi:MAG: glycosyltransferase family 87 protein [Bdellovibrionales bacterium]